MTPSAVAVALSLWHAASQIQSRDTGTALLEGASTPVLRALCCGIFSAGCDV